MRVVCVDRKEGGEGFGSAAPRNLSGPGAESTGPGGGGGAAAAARPRAREGQKSWPGFRQGTCRRRAGAHGGSLRAATPSPLPPHLPSGLPIGAVFVVGGGVGWGWGC